MRVCAIIPAAGTGERMGSEIPKQFLKVRGYPLVAYTVEAFLKLDLVHKVVVLVSPTERIKELESYFQNIHKEVYRKLTVIKGSYTRHRSILEGFKYLEEESKSSSENWDQVIIHDGVRPFVDQKILKEVVYAAKEHGAAGITCPLTSTIISIDDSGFLETCHDRNKMSASEMPQAFRFSVALNAYINCSDHDLDNGTECLKIIQDYSSSKDPSIRIKLIAGTPDYFKVTFPRDFYTIHSFVKGQDLSFRELLKKKMAI